MHEAMAEDHILSWSLPGDLVFNRMAEAGTTCKMALLSNWRYCGMEISERYCEIARERLRIAKRSTDERWASYSEATFRDNRRDPYPPLRGFRFRRNRNAEKPKRRLVNNKSCQMNEAERNRLGLLKPQWLNILLRREHKLRTRCRGYMAASSDTPQVFTPEEYVDRIGDLIRTGQTANLRHWGDGRFTVCQNGKWLYEGFVNLFQALHEAMMTIDPSIQPGLPPHCLDPKVICKFFRIPLKDMNAPENSGGGQCSAESPVHHEASGPDDSGLAALPAEETLAYISLNAAAKLIPGRTPGKRISKETIWRWCLRGLRNGVRLKSVLIGGQRYTTRSWVENFIFEINGPGERGANELPQPRSPGKRQRASESAAEELEARWRRRDGR